MMSCAVILNGVKNLEVSVAVVGSASLEILRYTQDDIESEEIATVAMLPRNDATTHSFRAIFRTRYFEIPFFMPIFVRLMRETFILKI